MNGRLNALYLGASLALSFFMTKPVMADASNKRTEFQFSAPVEIPVSTCSSSLIASPTAILCRSSRRIRKGTKAWLRPLRRFPTTAQTHRRSLWSSLRSGTRAVPRRFTAGFTPETTRVGSSFIQKGGLGRQAPPRLAVQAKAGWLTWLAAPSSLGALLFWRGARRPLRKNGSSAGVRTQS